VADAIVRSSVTAVQLNQKYFGAVTNKAFRIYEMKFTFYQNLCT